MLRKTEKLTRIYKRISLYPQNIDEIYQWTVKQDMRMSRRSLYRYLEEIESFFNDEQNEVIVEINSNNQKQWYVAIKAEGNDNSLSGSVGGVIHSMMPDYVHQMNSINNLSNAIQAPLTEKELLDTVIRKNTLWAKTGFGEVKYTDKQLAMLHTLHTCIEKGYITDISLSASFAKGTRMPISKCYAPVSIINHQNGIYIALKNPDNGKIVFVPMESISNVIPTGIVSPWHTDINAILQKFRKCFSLGIRPFRVYEIELKMNGSKCAYSAITDAEMFSQRTWHPNQQPIVSSSKKECVINFQSYLTRELVLWILGFGETIIISKPEKLRKLCLASAQKMLINYEKSISPSPVD